MQFLLKFIEEIDSIKIPEELSASAKCVLESPDLTPAVAEHILTLWNHKEFNALALALGDDIQLQGGIFGVKYYFENAKRFAEPDYRPTKEDLLKARRKTTGILETQFMVESNEFIMVDVGGQRSERKKWLHCFTNVSAVLFLTAINEYDMVLEEDVNTNRLVESLKLWKAITSSQFFKRTPFILFLNKKDLFQEKISKSPLVEIFSDYEQFVKDPANCDAKWDDYEKGWKYIEKQYKIQFSGSQFYPHLTCALDTEQCRKVFLVIQEKLLTDVLAGSGLITT